jgi:hypothetical protein
MEDVKNANMHAKNTFAQAKDDTIRHLGSIGALTSAQHNAISYTTRGSHRTKTLGKTREA